MGMLAMDTAIRTDRNRQRNKQKKKYHIFNNPGTSMAVSSFIKKQPFFDVLIPKRILNWPLVLWEY